VTTHPSLPGLKAEIAFASNPADTPVYVDVSAYVRSVDITRGRQRELDVVEAGTADITLSNRDRRFDPTNTGTLVNLVPNPSFEVNTAGWAAAGNTTAFNRYGGDHKSGSFALAGDAVAAGAFGMASGSVVQGVPLPLLTYTLSCWVQAPAGRVVTVQLNETGGSIGDEAVASVNFTGIGIGNLWQRVTCTGTIGRADRAGLYILVTCVATAAGQTLWVDGVQLELGSQATAYCDGDQDNCRWAGTPHASQSYRGGPYYPNVLPMRRVRLSVPSPNVVLNGGFETNASGWTLGDTTLTRDTTRARFGAASGRLDVTGTANPYAFDAFYGISGATAGRTFTHSMWIYGEGTSIGKIWQIVILEEGGAFGNEGVATVFTVQAGWQRVVNTRTVVRNDRTAIASYIQWVGSGPAVAIGDQLWLDGAQLEEGKEATPYIGDAGTTHYLYTGYIESWPPRRNGPLDADVTIHAVDGFAVLANVDLNEVYGQQLSGAYVTQVLDDVGWPASERVIDAGNATIVSSNFTASPTQALGHLQDVARSEFGVLYVDAQGRLVFADRHHRLVYQNTPVATFGDGGPGSGEFPYSDLTPSYDVAEVYNEILVSQPGVSIPASSISAASIAQFFRRTLSYDTLLAVFGEADLAADYLLSRYKDPYERFDVLEIKPRGDMPGVGDA
jgi:hypothetical protein